MADIMQCPKCNEMVTVDEGAGPAGSQCARCGSGLIPVELERPTLPDSLPRDQQKGAMKAAARSIGLRPWGWFVVLAAVPLLIAACWVLFRPGRRAAQVRRTTRAVREVEDIDDPTSLPVAPPKAEPAQVADDLPAVRRIPPRLAFGVQSQELADKLADVLRTHFREITDCSKVGALTVWPDYEVDIVVGRRRLKGKVFRRFGLFVLTPGELTMKEFYVLTRNHWWLSDTMGVPKGTYLAYRGGQCRVMEKGLAESDFGGRGCIITLINRTRIPVHVDFKTTRGMKRNTVIVGPRQKKPTTVRKGAYVINWQANVIGQFWGSSWQQRIDAPETWVFEMIGTKVTAQVYRGSVATQIK